MRCPVEADASAIIAIAGDWDVARRLGRMPHPYSHEDFRFFMERVVPSEPTWAIVLRQTNELVGVIGLNPHGDNRSAELGYYVGRPHWGRGFATEAAEADVWLCACFIVPREIAARLSDTLRDSSFNLCVMGDS